MQKLLFRSMIAAAVLSIAMAVSALASPSDPLAGRRSVAGGASLLWQNPAELITDLPQQLTALRDSLAALAERLQRSYSGRYDPESYVRPTSLFTDIAVEKIILQNGDDAQLIRYIQTAIDPRFDKSQFQTEYSDGLLIYRYQIGEIVSNFGYIFHVDGKQVLGYKQMGSILYDMPMPDMASVPAMQEKALEKHLAETKNTDRIVEQTVSVSFDSGAREFVYFVLVGYEDENGGQYGLTAEYRQRGDALVEK